MKETASSIASRLGISVGTVSRILSGKAEQNRISPATVRRVLDEAARCGYVRPLRVKKKSADVRPDLIGLVLPTLEADFGATLAHSLVCEFEAAGYNCILKIFTDGEKLPDQFTSLMSAGVKAIVTPYLIDYKSVFKSLESSDIPVIFIDNHSKDLKIPYVSTDNFKAGAIAAEKLVANGHKKTALIQFDDSLPTNIERTQGYVSVMEKYGLEPTVACGTMDFDTSLDVAGAMLGAQDRPTAIFALAPQIERAVEMAAHELGLRIPEDLSVITMDSNLKSGRDVCSIYQPLGDMAKAAVALTLKCISSPIRIITGVKLTPIINDGMTIRNLNGTLK